MKINITERAKRLGEQDGLNAEFMGQCATINGGHAYWFIYHAYESNGEIYIETLSELEERTKNNANI